MPLNLNGEKILLRALEERDIPAICASYADFDLQLTTDGDAPPQSEAQVKAFWTEIIANPDANLRYFAIEALPESASGGQVVGACSLQHIDTRNRHAELSIFMIGRESRGQGYGTDAVRVLLRYAFEVVRLDKVYLGVYEFNEAGIRSYERAGFRYEGRLRQMLYYDGRYWDEWHMGMLRSEWERHVQTPAEGLRPYHPDDLEAAVDLIRRLGDLPDSETARAVLRRWWRLLDRVVYSYQTEGSLIGLLTLVAESNPPIVLDVVGSSDFRTALQNALAMMVKDQDG